MSLLSIANPKELKGTVKVSGSKNAAIPIICTSLLTDYVKLSNVPQISDIYKLLDVLEYVNVKAKWKNDNLYIDSRNIIYKPLTIEACSQIRGSYYLIPVFLYLFDKCEIILPGGCKIGQRPIDSHLDAIKAFGYKYTINDNYLKILRDKRVNNIDYSITKKSVGASINTILLALKTQYSVINNLNIEPEGYAVVEFLRLMGFSISLLNNKSVVKFSIRNLKPIKYKIIPDRMEAMTFVVMGLLCGKIKIKNADISHIKYPLTLLLKSKYDIKIMKDMILSKKSSGRSFDITTEEYPGFPTDLQSIFGILLNYSYGSCVINETIFENRMQIYDDLIKIGSDITLIDNKAFINGVINSNPIVAKANDLRHAASLAILALRNGGAIDNIELIDRGYENFFSKIAKLGAKFKITTK
ncbi:MAG: UDP-N-acetylglucosamine 1-carboxyvinyltransferase [Acholeplasmatales bacterium]|nr:UDP-N-acetylglucosamine 1-carboxyvinyltransferase [Acholeplasmatales bacterium]